MKILDMAKDARKAAKVVGAAEMGLQPELIPITLAKMGLEDLALKGVTKLVETAVDKIDKKKDDKKEEQSTGEKKEKNDKNDKKEEADASTTSNNSNKEKDSAEKKTTSTDNEDLAPAPSVEVAAPVATDDES